MGKMMTVTSTEILSLQQQNFSFILRLSSSLLYALTFRTVAAAFCTVESTTLPFVLTDSFLYSGFQERLGVLAAMWAARKRLPLRTSTIRRA